MYGHLSKTIIAIPIPTPWLSNTGKKISIVREWKYKKEV